MKKLTKQELITDSIDLECRLEDLGESKEVIAETRAILLYPAIVSPIAPIFLNSEDMKMKSWNDFAIEDIKRYRVYLKDSIRAEVRI